MTYVSIAKFKSIIFFIEQKSCKGLRIIQYVLNVYSFQGIIDHYIGIHFQENMLGHDKIHEKFIALAGTLLGAKQT